MYTTTRGIVFQRTNYSDTSLIVKIFTEASGLQSYILKGVKKSTKGLKPALFQNLALLSFEASHKPNHKLHFIREASPFFSPRTIPSDFRKMAVLLFMNEILLKSIREEEANQNLFQFIADSVENLDLDAQNIAIFPIHFMIHLSRHLGFFPGSPAEVENRFFDLADGVYRPDMHPLHPSLSIAAGQYLSFLAINEDVLLLDNRNVPDPETKRNLLQGLLSYYSLHVPGFSEIKSYKVLAEVLHPA